MAPSSNIKQEEEEELTVLEALANDNSKGKMVLLNLCVIFTTYLCYIMFALFKNAIIILPICICYIIIMILHRNIYWRSRWEERVNGYIG